MSLPSDWSRRMRLPVICAPLFRVTTPELIVAARRAGVIGALPRANAPSFEVFEEWLRVAATSSGTGESSPWSPPLAVNLSTRMDPDELERHLLACTRHGVELIISATGDPSALIERAHAHGLRLFADAVNLRFADKAIAAGADGIIAIGAGGGGHSGTVNHLTLVSAIRSRFRGTVVMAGAIGDGAAVRAGEVLGADLAYLGTRFIATRESGAPDAYKTMLVNSGLKDLIYTPNLNGVAANWLRPSMVAVGLDPDQLPPRPEGRRGYDHLPDGVVPWGNLWSAGQGVEAIDDIPSVAELVERLEREYRAACAVPAFAGRR